MLSILKNTVFLLWLVGVLASVSITAKVFAIKSATTVAQLSSQMAANAIRHRKEVSRTVAKAKAKARLQRMITMVPVAGIAAGAYFEEQEYQEWLVDNPKGTRQDYLCEVAQLSSKVLDEVLLDLPDMLSPPEAVTSKFIPKCATV